MSQNHWLSCHIHVSFILLFLLFGGWLFSLVISLFWISTVWLQVSKVVCVRFACLFGCIIGLLLFFSGGEIMFWSGVPGITLFVFLVYHSERVIFVAFGSLCLLLLFWCIIRRGSLFIIKLHKPSSLIVGLICYMGNLIPCRLEW